jgi:signal transduction histidine kinase
MTSSTAGTSSTALWQARWRRFSSASVRAFHAYGNWLIGISWRRFFVLSLALLVVVGIVHDLPPFTWKYTEEVSTPPRVVVVPQRPSSPQKPQKAPQAPKAPAAQNKGESIGDVQISIGKDGIKIMPRSAAQAASAADGTASAAAGAGVEIKLPPGVASEAVREALEEARQGIEQAVREARQDAEQATRDAEQARRDAEAAVEELTRELGQERTHTRTRRIGIGNFMMQFAFLWVLASAILKYTYKGRVQAEVKAAQATETAEAESLKRQVVEARMAAMQAQVEPHFLFNTLASIDHLIETDPPRASTMQKNLIALLRASMPTMREANDGGVRDLGRELAVIRPYLEILKVRMEERLTTDIQVPEGLLSAEFPPMMIQTLVENAIKHGLEPKAEGGTLKLKAEIVHGKLQMTVADTGLGFGKAATAGTGVGLANIRERLQLLYGPRAALTVAENQPSGTVVTITVPYKTIEGTVS